MRGIWKSFEFHQPCLLKTEGWTETSVKSIKKLEQNRVKYQHNSKSLNYEDCEPTDGEANSGRYSYNRDHLDDGVDRILNKSIECENESDDLEGQGIEKITIPSNIIVGYTGLEVLLGLKLSGDTDTLTEASKLIDEFYKRGEIENEH